MAMVRGGLTLLTAHLERREHNNFPTLTLIRKRSSLWPPTRPTSGRTAAALYRLTAADLAELSKAFPPLSARPHSKCCERCHQGVMQFGC
jgi:hypothetical protein